MPHDLGVIVTVWVVLTAVIIPLFLTALALLGMVIYLLVWNINKAIIYLAAIAGRK